MVAEVWDGDRLLGDVIVTDRDALGVYEYLGYTVRVIEDG